MAKTSEVENKNAFLKLADATYVVDLPISEGRLKCRHVPFTTVMHILSELVTNTHAEVLNARKIIAEELLRVGDVGGFAEALKEGGVGRFIGVFGPLLAGVVTAVPELVERLLLDVIVDITLPVVRMLPVEDGLTVINAAFDEMDKALLAKQATQLFFGLSKTVDAMATVLETNATPQEESLESGVPSKSGTLG